MLCLLHPRHCAGLAHTASPLTPEPKHQVLLVIVLIFIQEKNEGTEQVGDLIRNFSKTTGQDFGEGFSCFILEAGRISPS